MLLEVTARSGSAVRQLRTRSYRIAAIALLAASWAGAAGAADPEAAVSRAAVLPVPAALAPAPFAPEPRLYHSASYRQPTFPGSSFDTGAFRAWSASRGSVQLFESPRDYTPGQPIRRSPRLALGFRSNALRNAMEAIGIDAQTCMAPIVRLRGKMDSNGDVNGTFWVSARCTFR